ncbi:hypothetical protein [Streptosporangium sp. KLBMP 9127]|nr:hypothetical protein [Streptosporangium sp. KLBMP 9127]
MRLPTKAAVICVALPCLTLAGCARAATPSSAPSGVPSTATTAPAAAQDTPCARVVSALGFADLLLAPEGQERRQSFDDAVRGRLAYVEGVLLEYGSRLPPEVLPHEAELRRTTRGLAPAATPRGERIRLLKDYRTAAGAVRRACPST